MAKQAKKAKKTGQRRPGKAAKVVKAVRVVKVAPPVAAYPAFLAEVKKRIRVAQVRAALAANEELIRLYWDIGRAISGRQREAGWGAAVIPRLARDLHNELPEVKGFSERNLKRMVAFFREYPDLGPIVPQAAAQLPPASGPVLRPSKGSPIVPQAAAQLENPASESRAAKGSPILPQPAAKLTETTSPSPLALRIPWFHNILLMEKIKDPGDRLWYMRKTVEHGWSRSILGLMIQSEAHKREGKAVTNFAELLPPPQSDLARDALKDPYLFDFLTLTAPFQERELETGLLRHFEQFLLELGAGFSFVGRQHRVEVGDDDYYIDLLFYHFVLRCFIVIDLKKGAFKPEHIGKMNFYCNLVDDRLRQPSDNPTIGLILCQDRDRLVAEYALRGLKKAIGVSQYQITRALPKELRSSLPSVEQIEAELEEATAERPRRKDGKGASPKSRPSPRRTRR